MRLRIRNIHISKILIYTRFYRVHKLYIEMSEMICHGFSHYSITNQSSPVQMVAWVFKMTSAAIAWNFAAGGKIVRKNISKILYFNTLGPTPSLTRDHLFS